MQNPSVTKNAKKLANEGTYVGPMANVIRATAHGKTVLFCINNTKDVIQSRHVRGEFYEQEELAIISRHFPIGGVFIDIGSNIGNHALYAAMFLHAERVHLIEPNPLAITLLEANIYLNNLENICDVSLLGIGLSDQQQTGLSMQTPSKNLGGARMIPEGGDLDVYRADEVFTEVTPDFVKIDVEGMEIAVLEGMAGILMRCRPKMFIEVDKKNNISFHKWCAENGYQVVEEFKRYATNTNYLIEPTDT